MIPIWLAVLLTFLTGAQWAFLGYQIGRDTERGRPRR